MTTGQTGSGKSWSNLAICEAIDPTFNINRVVFRGKELMDLINSGKLPDRRGNTFLFDEAGIDMSARSWQSVTNKMLNFLLQTFRHKCFILLFTTPYEDFVDSATRKLFHAEFRTQGIDFNRDCVRLRPKLLQYNPEMKKFYKKYLRVVTPNGVRPLEIWRVFKPSEKLVKEYEEKKTKFTTELNINIGRQLHKVYNKQVTFNTKPLTARQEVILELKNKGMTDEKIGEELGISRQLVNYNVNWIRNKGIDLERRENLPLAT